jgi:transcriptional regulator with XRE-family HTH domain
MQTVSADALRELLRERGISLDAAGVLAGVDTSTVSRVVSGKARARPVTIVRLAKALGVSARRLQVMCDAAWAGAQVDEDEAVSA